MSWKNTLILTLLICLLAGAQTATARDRRLERKVDAYMAPLLERDLISGSILIASRGEILLAKGYGLANREYEMPNTPDTAFRLGSVSKQFTAMGIFLLAQEGKLALEDKLSLYLPEYPRGDEITLHMLLNHTSGIPNYTGLEDYDTQLMLPLSIDEVIDFFKEAPLHFEPGGNWAYSNSGYVLLARVSEIVSGLPFAELLRERIFTPLGMTCSGVDVCTDIIPGRATGHVNQGDGVFQTPYRDMPFTSGAGALYSTVNDMFKWDRALYTDVLLNGEWRTKMFEPVMNEYANGWFVREEFGQPIVEHGGAINGFLTQINRFPEEELVIISLFNYETTFWRRVNHGLAAMALGEDYDPALRHKPLELDLELLNMYAGEYELMPGYIVKLSVEGNSLMVEAPEHEREAVEAQSETLFYLPGGAALMQVDFIDADTIRGVRIQQGANSFPCRRLE
ncbi:MAG: beta-lactamase family protein [bacterium]|nr:beta-lactamase family protein [bacterium]